jgi:hypothetical protein
MSEDPIQEEGGINLYGYVASRPINAVDQLGLDWTDKAEAIWTALGYTVTGSEIPGAAAAAPDAAKILILTAFKKACRECLEDPPNDDCLCKICDDYAKVISKLSD